MSHGYFETISQAIRSQFPDLFLDEASSLVDFLVAYYEFMEDENTGPIHHARKMIDYNDVDETLDKFLVFFKRKYMPSLNLNSNTDKRFILKNIIDFYRSKGSEEGLRIFFRLFFQEEIDVYYPAKDILTVSNSLWKRQKYLEVSAITEPISDVVGNIIVGTVSGASASVQRVVKKNVNNTFLYVIYIDDLTGTFTAGDFIRISGSTTNYAKVLGSLNNIFTLEYGASNNELGDILDIVDVNGNGRGGKVVVTGLADAAAGNVSFSILNGGFGYTANSDLYISNQILYLDTSNTNFEKFQVISDQFGVESTIVEVATNFLAVDISNTANGQMYSNASILTGNVDIDTVSPLNESAYFEIGEIVNEDTIDIFVDLLSDFANVSLVANNYGMSGGNTVNANTTLGDAFSLNTITVGEIGSLVGINYGSNYETPVYAIVKNDEIADFEFKSYILTLEYSDVVDTLEVGDILSQSNGAKVKITNIDGLTFYVKRISFENFTESLPAKIVKYTTDVFVMVTEVETDPSYEISGQDARIIGSVVSETGLIANVEIHDSGFGYPLQFNYQILNADGEVAASGTANSITEGTSAGRWLTKSSHLNYASGKKIRDNDFYQEYSYEISSSIQTGLYEESLKSTAHVAGTKMFSKFLLNKDVSVDQDISMTILGGEYNFEVLVDENFDPIVDESNNEIILSIGPFDFFGGVDYSQLSTRWYTTLDESNNIVIVSANTIANTANLDIYTLSDVFLTDQSNNIIEVGIREPAIGIADILVDTEEEGYDDEINNTSS